MSYTLLILAAGLASRYGSLKQIDKVGPSGERIIDYSVYDAFRSGFRKVVYVIRKSFEDEFRELILDKLPSEIEASYVCQEIDSVPPGFDIPEKRVKPWGTAHALMVSESKISEPFAVINADDFYGYNSFKLISNFLNNNNKNFHYSLVAYKLKNTLSENGFVSRGICEVDEQKYLTSIIERSKIYNENGHIYYKDESERNALLRGDEIVSMNLFAFTPTIFKHLKKNFNRFLYDNRHDLNAEFQLPTIINSLIQSDKIIVKSIVSNERWFGLTYKEDKILVRNNIKQLVDKKIYPNKLWSEII